MNEKYRYLRKISRNINLQMHYEIDKTLIMQKYVNINSTTQACNR